MIRFWFAIGLVCGCVSFTFASDDLLEDTGPPGITDEEALPPGTDADWWPALVPNSPYEGPLGQVDNRQANDACENCFTIPGMEDGYQIFESIPVGEDAEHILLRRVANPAPLEAGEVRPTVDEAGEPLWYIGTQAYSGPQDTEIIPGIGRSMIAVKRIRHRHEAALLAFSGVHGVGITATGIGVHVLPGHDTSLIPPDVEGIPVEILITPRPVFQHHHTTRFRPVQIGAGIYVSGVGGGTLGPHITRNPGTCCQVWSLTASHVVRTHLDDPVPAPGTLQVHQPTVQATNIFGYVAHLFRLDPCGTTADDSACYETGAPLNDMTVNPDIAAIDGNPYNTTQPEPYNTPTGTDPIRRLTSSATSYINGPSGRIRVAESGHNLKVWGAYGGPRTGRVQQVDQTIFPALGGDVYRLCCLSSMAAATQAGDSGAVVTYGGTGNRHVAGVHIAGDGNTAWFIPSDDIKTAFSGAGKAFEHYWGTRSGYRSPATTTCDPPGC